MTAYLWIASWFACALLLMASASARDVKVRVFSATPPTEITLVPRATTVKTCSACAVHKLTSALTVKAQAKRLSLGTGEQRTSLIVEGDYELRATDRAPVRLQSALSIRADDGVLVLVASMALEEYVVAVVAGEASTMRSDEALKAAAVAARTYAVRFGARHKMQGFNLCDSTHCQVANFGAAEDRVQYAVAATAGELLWFNGSLAASYYSRNCGGQTEDARQLWPDMHAAYLVAHEDPHCRGATDSHWETVISCAEMRRVGAALKLVPGELRNISVETRTPSGRNSRIRIGPQVVDAQTFRFAIGRVLGWNRVRSDAYEVQSSSEGFRFIGRGAGHGVGMCQRGAAHMAERGSSYRQILAFYYPGTKVGLTAQGLGWNGRRGERAELLATRSQDSAVLEVAERIVVEIERSTQQSFSVRPQLRVYPTVETFRDATGEPGWVAASTRGAIIRLQPTDVLRQLGTLESTLRHELLHVMIESQAKATTPLWLREGLVLHLASPANSGRESHRMLSGDLDRRLRSPRTRVELNAAYAEALSRTRALIGQHGLSTVLGWLEKGMPAGSSQVTDTGTSSAKQH